MEQYWGGNQCFFTKQRTQVWKITPLSILSSMQERSCKLLEYLTIHTLKYKLFAVAAAEVKRILGYLAAPSVNKSRLTHN